MKPPNSMLIRTAPCRLTHYRRAGYACGGCKWDLNNIQLPKHDRKPEYPVFSSSVRKSSTDRSLNPSQNLGAFDSSLFVSVPVSDIMIIMTPINRSEETAYESKRFRDPLRGKAETNNAITDVPGVEVDVLP